MSASRILGLLALALLPAAVAAQGPFRVRAFVDPAQGASESSRIRLVIEVEGAGNIPLTPPTLGAMKNLRVTSGPQSSFESVWSNGRFSSKSTLIYSLQAVGAGPAEVPPIEVVVGTESYRTQPIRFDVAASRGGAPPRTLQSAPPDRAGVARDADVFIRAELGSSTVWVGQSVPLSVSLYAAEQVVDFKWTDEPALASFWSEDLAIDPNAESHRATVEGRHYTVFPMKRKILVPQTSGKFAIEPYALEIQVRQRSNDPFDLFSFGRGTAVLRKTQPLSIEVRPLPAAGRPDGFGGAVGSYRFEASFDRQSAKVNDAVALTATVQGEGFLGAVEPPRIDLPPDLKIFDPKVSQTSRGGRGAMVSRKTWEWVLVPLVPGQLRVGDLSFTYFDPASGRYETATAALAPLVVERGTTVEEPALAHGEVLLQRRELAFIKARRGPLRADASAVHRRGTFLVLLAAPLAWVPLAVLLTRHRARLQQNLGLVRSRRARARALKRLRAAGRLVEAGTSAAFHEEVGRTLVEYIADRFNRSAAGLTYEATEELLAAKGLDPEARRRFRSCLESCDFARFVPAAARGERRAELLQEAREVLELLERTS